MVKDALVARPAVLDHVRDNLLIGVKNTRGLQVVGRHHLASDTVFSGRGVDVGGALNDRANALRIHF